MTENITRDELLSALRAHIQHDHKEHAQDTLDHFNSLQRSVYWGPIWHRVKSLLEAWPDEEHEVPVALCEQQLLHWPNTARSESGWLTSAHLNTCAPKLRLLGRLNVDRRPFEEQLNALEHPEALPHVRELYISGALPLEQLTKILSSPIIAQITSLQIGYGQLGPEHIKALLNTSARQQLKSLTLHRAEIGPQGAKLLGSEQWPELEHLDLHKGHITDQGLEALLAQDHFPKLTELRLPQNELTAKAAEQLTRHELTLLDLEFNHGRAAMSKALASSPNLAKLEHLNLGANEIGDVGLKALAKSPYMSALRSLNLRGNHRKPLISDKGVEALASSKTIQGLETLNLDQNPLTDQGLAALLSSPSMSKLRSLSITHNKNIDLATATALTTIEPIAPLRALDLTYCGLSDKAAAAKLLPKLNLPKTLDTLGLFGVGFDVDMLDALGQHPHLLQRLRLINLSGTPANTKHINALCALSMPALERLEIGDSDQQATPVEVELLSQAHWFSQLIYLNVKVTEEGSAALKPHTARHMITCWS